ncbi:hypothetical protein [Mucilaginibacter sp.]
MIFAQNVSNYNLLPGSKIILPVGAATTFKIYWNGNNGEMITGTATEFILKILPPLWTLNGKQSNAPANAEGHLSSDMSFMRATYTAPDKVPKINPVTVAVKFKANDSSKEEVTLLCNVEIVDPGKNWYFRYSCTQSSEETWKSTNEDHTKRSSGSGSGTMIVDAPPEQNGYVIINTEQGDPVINSTVSGTYTYYESDITTGPNNEVDEKTIRKYSGTPKKGQGLLFEYNSKDKGDQGGIQDAGIGFNITGTDEIWNHDANGKLRKVTNPADEKGSASIGLGHKEDKVTKIKNGFTIEYSQSKDSSNTYAGGVKHTFKSTEQYMRN